MNRDQTNPQNRFPRSNRNDPRRSGLTAFLLCLGILLASCQEAVPPELPAANQTPLMQSSPTPEATIVEATSTPVPTITPEPTPTFDISTVEDWGAGRLIFNLMEHSFGEKASRGIYALDLESDTLTEVLPEGTKLLDISPDRKRILTAIDSELTIFDLGNESVQTLAEDYYSMSPSGAKWDRTENRIYYLAIGESGTTVHRVDPDSGESEELAVTSPIAVLEADRGVVVLGRGTCNPFGECAYIEQEWITGGGDRIASYEIGESIMLPCQRSNEHVYAEMNQAGAVSLHIQPHDQGHETVFWAVKPEYSDCAWSPDETRLAVILIDRYWYSGSIQNYYFQILVPGTSEIIDIPLKAPLDQVFWSPDGKYTAFTGTRLYEESYQIEITLVELNSLRVSRFNQPSEFQSENYLAIPVLFWAP